jgi:hypothetical protein
MSRPQKRIVRTPESGEPTAPPQVTGKGRYMTVTLPADDDDTVVVEHHEEPEADHAEPQVSEPASSKYDRRASSARAAPSDETANVASTDEESESVTESTGVEHTEGVVPVSSSAVPAASEAPDYVEPDVPEPAFNKYDRRASAASEDAAADVDVAVEQVEIDLTDDATPDPSLPAFVSIYDQQIQQEEAEAAARRAATAVKPDPFAAEDGLTYWQRHSANLPRLEEESD